MVNHVKTLRGHFRDTHKADLALVAKLADGTELFLDWDRVIDPVQLPHIERLDAKTAQASLAVGSRRLGPPIGTAAGVESRPS